MSTLGREILEYLYDEADVQVRFLGKAFYGRYDPNGDKICINVWSSIALIVVHEWLHHKYNDWSERKVRANEELFLQKLTREEIIEIAQIVLSKV